jgi:hypothetical protein
VAETAAPAALASVHGDRGRDLAVDIYEFNKSEVLARL